MSPPSRSTDPLASDDELGFRVLTAIRQILRSVSAHSRKVSRETGLSIPKLLVMRAIERDAGEEITVAGVSRTVGLSPSTVSPLIEKLVRAGLVSRVRSTRDRRRVNLSLTPEGTQQLSKMPGLLEDRFLRGLASLSEDERQTILDSFERVSALIGASEVDASPMLVPGVDLMSREEA